MVNFSFRFLAFFLVDFTESAAGSRAGEESNKTSRHFTANEDISPVENTQYVGGENLVYLFVFIKN